MNSYFKGLILSLFVLATAVDGSRAFAASQCRNVFSSPASPIKNNSILEVVKPVTEDFFRQLQQGIPLTNIQLKVDGVVLQTLEWMRDQIHSTKASDLQTIPETERNIIWNGISKTQERLAQAVQQKNIGYFDYLDLAQRTAAGITAKQPDYSLTKDTGSMSNVLRVLSAETFPERTSRPIVEMINDFLLLPLTTQLGVVSMNRLQAQGVAVLGLTNKTEFVDGSTLRPNAFFEHDFAHAVIYGLRVLSRTERMDFYTHFEKWMSLPGVSARSQQIRTSLWFIVFHELGAPIHPAGLEKKLIELKETTIYDLDFLLVRLNNPQDLGYSFKNQNLTKDELITEMDALLEFAHEQSQK